MEITKTKGLSYRHPLIRDDLPRDPSKWRNKDPKPCQFCGKMFWHRSFHIFTTPSGEIRDRGPRKTCSSLCSSNLSLKNRGRVSRIGKCEVCDKVISQSIGDHHYQRLKKYGLKKRKTWCSTKCLRIIKKRAVESRYYQVISTGTKSTDCLNVDAH